MLFLSGGLTPGPLFLNGRTMTSQPYVPLGNKWHFFGCVTF